MDSDDELPVSDEDVNDAEDDLEEESEEDDELLTEDDDGSIEGSIENSVPTVRATLTSKDGNVLWETEPLQARGRKRAHDIFRQRAGPARNIDPQTPADAILHFFSDDILDRIVECTNKKAASSGTPGTGRDWKTIDRDELIGFLGLIYLAGVLKSRGEAVESLWSEEWGRPHFRATMTRVRFQQILRFIRFDETSTRADRQKDDRLAAFRDISDKLTRKFRDAYVPHQNVTVDEMLHPFRGHCRFKVYMPSKPAKYGLKFWICADSETSYCWNVQPYLGKTTSRPEKGQHQRVVSDLVEPMAGSGRNITIDNFFTSLSLGNWLLQQKLTMVGTLRKSRGEIPVDMLPSRSRAECSTMFGFTKDTTIVSYVPKKNRSVVLLSTLHHDAVVSEDKKHKPEVILYYNATKGGVDNLDKMCAQYSCKRATKRWPLSMFFCYMNIVGVNAGIIWLATHPLWKTFDGGPRSDRRRLFLLEAASALARRWIDRRAMQPRIALQPTVKRSIEALGITVTKPSSQREDLSTSAAKRRCYFCPASADRKTKSRCHSCKQAMCTVHMGPSLCIECSVNAP